MNIPGEELNKGLIILPWIGEFGWELMEWNALCRAVSRDFNSVTSYCQEGKEYLYSDFSDEVIGVKVPKKPRDRWFMFEEDNYEKKTLSEQFFSRAITLKGNNSLLFLTTNCKKRKLSFPKYRYTRYDHPFPFRGKQYVPEYYSFGVQDESPDVIFHIRNRKFVRQNDNWSISRWVDLRDRILKRGLSIGCIGSVEESLVIDGTTDYRGEDLLKITSLLKSCKVSIGPESGPTHLAALSGGNNIVWSRAKENKKRCEEFWNPLEAKCLFVNDGNPDAKSIFELVTEFLY